MRKLGLGGAIRGRRFKTTVSNPSATRPADLVHRAFVATRPNALWVNTTGFGTYRSITANPGDGPSVCGGSNNLALGSFTSMSGGNEQEYHQGGRRCLDQWRDEHHGIESLRVACGK